MRKSLLMKILNSSSTRNRRHLDQFKGVSKKSQALKNLLNLTKSVIWNRCCKPKNEIVDQGDWAKEKLVEGTELLFPSLLDHHQWIFRIRDFAKIQGAVSTHRIYKEDLLNDHHQLAAKIQEDWNHLVKEKFLSRKMISSSNKITNTLRRWNRGSEDCQLWVTNLMLSKRVWTQQIVRIS